MNVKALRDIAIIVVLIAVFFVVGGVSAGGLFQSSSVSGTLNEGLIAHYTFDGVDMNWEAEQALDRTGSHNGSLEGMSTTSTPVHGRLGQALLFDSNDDRVVVSHDAAFNVLPLSISAWVKFDTQTDDPGIVNKYNEGSLNGWNLFIDGGDLCTWYFSDNSNNVYDGDSDCSMRTSGYDDNEWHHVAVVYNSSGGEFFVDGTSVDTQGWTGSPAAPSNTVDVSIGRYLTGDPFFGGLIDDVRIYGRSLLASEITKLYNHGGGAKVQVTSTVGESTNGLLSHWTLDGPNVNWGTNKATDSVGSSDLVLTNMSTSSTPTLGILGQSLAFNSRGSTHDSGANQLRGLNATVTAVPTAAGSVCMWVYTNAYPLSTTNRGSLFEAWVDFSNAFTVGLETNGTVEVGLLSTGAQSTNPVSLNDWTHICGTWDSTDFYAYVDGVLDGNGGSGVVPANADDFYIGLPINNAPGHNGLIDDIRIYDHALTASEVLSLHNQGGGSKEQTSFTPLGLDNGLVGHWTFDGGDTNWGTNTTNDVSANSNNGTITNMSTTTTPVKGVAGQAFNFDGQDSHINAGNDSSLADISESITVTAWVRPEKSSRGDIVGMWSADGINNGKFDLLGGLTANKFQFFVSDGTSLPDSGVSTTNFVVGHWYHVVGVADGSADQVHIYVNGVLENSGAFTGTLNTTSINPLGIGIAHLSGGPSQSTDGDIDDVRIYNRVLSASEIAQLYNLGN